MHFLLKSGILRRCSCLLNPLCSAPIFCRTGSSIFKRLYNNITVKGVNMSHTKFYLIWSKISGTLKASKITIFLNFSVKLLYCWYLVLVVTSYFHETCRTKKAKKSQLWVLINIKTTNFCEVRFFSLGFLAQGDSISLKKSKCPFRFINTLRSPCYDVTISGKQWLIKWEWVIRLR